MFKGLLLSLLITSACAHAIKTKLVPQPGSVVSGGTSVVLPVGISDGGTGQTTKAAGFNALSPMTTGGDLIYGGASGTGTRLANGTAGYFLLSNGTTLAPSWATVSLPNTSWLTGGGINLIRYDGSGVEIGAAGVQNIMRGSNYQFYPSGDITLDPANGKVNFVGNGSTIPGLLRLHDNGADGVIQLSAPADVTNYDLKLPAAQGAANTYLKNDGSGNTSWAAAGTVFPILAPDGTAGAPSYSFSTGGADSTGIAFLDSFFTLVAGATKVAQIANSGIYPGVSGLHFGTTAQIWKDIKADELYATNQFIFDGDVVSINHSNSGEIGFAASGGYKLRINDTGSHFTAPVDMNSQEMTEVGHVITAGSAPAVTSCGTSPSVVGTDTAGRITVGTGGIASSCTLTFNAAFTNAALCVVVNESTSLLLKGTASTTALVVTAAAPFGASDLLVYHCLGYN